MIFWASTAKLDQTISVRGTLEPESSIREIDSPASGVIQTVLVTEGQSISAGDPLVSFQQEDLTTRQVAINERLKLIDYELLALNTIAESKSLDSINIPKLLPSDSSTYSQDLVRQLQFSLDKSEQLLSQLKQLDIRISSKKVSLDLKESIASDLQPLYDSGGIARNSYLQQLNSLQELRAEIATLNSESVRLKASLLSKINDLNTLHSSPNPSLFQLISNFRIGRCSPLSPVRFST